MNIKIGQMFENKTWKLLGPCLSIYGSIFTDKLNTVFKLAAGIGDANHYNPTPSIYLLCDAKYQPRNFIKFLEWIKYEPFYVADYPYSPDLKEVRKHMVVIKIPKPYLKAYEHFLKGEYSQMFSTEQVNTLFIPTDDLTTLGILLKKEYAFKTFLENQNRVYGTNVKPEDVKVMPKEYDFPLNKKEEIFYYE